ncbi:Cys-tRNA(Pro) deacylase [Ornithinimicrobium tianjinense]|uniref:Cys-tRNA(Pro)/Cys-tRNA(Cys) deacylase n=1 Tax=Ornithinimicrobium tianjinense TaxID=1195761 RepID=A0A917BKZ9_9MICO|nr:Cys-tRNA(Pro) deacylase [Ornithinimicrobium tianjinense]GGF47414.1 Cys-tRNA(Pro)/Cys-tRNA(Cys) deacylase [Ornithinimicrobium tianjinense]
MAKKQRTAGGTPATVTLDKAGVHYEVRAYEHDPSVGSYGLEAAEALGVEPARVFKTLLVHTDKGLGVGIVPVDTLLDLKAVAGALGAKKATMADPAVAERTTGYVVGGISPIGQKKRLPTVLDASATAFGTVLVSGGKRGFDLELAPEVLVEVTGATTAPIARRA